jgi:hypothetical protein
MLFFTKYKDDLWVNIYNLSFHLKKLDKEGECVAHTSYFSYLEGGG